MRKRFVAQVGVDPSKRDDFEVTDEGRIVIVCFIQLRVQFEFVSNIPRVTHFNVESVLILRNAKTNVLVLKVLLQLLHCVI